MNAKTNRREFIKKTTTAAAGVGLFALSRTASLGAGLHPVRIGMVGVGGRGTELLSLLLSLEGVEVPAICDINLQNLNRAQGLVEKSGRPRPEGYSRDEVDFRHLMTRDDLDAVVMATPWNWHTPMAVAGMKAGKYVGVEVPAAITLDQCWDLVNTSEQTGMPCMMLENWSFRRDNLAVLNMIRAGLLGEVVHCHCAHSHNCVDHWFFDTAGKMRWGGEFLVKRNGSQYTTHALGPVLSWMDINCGDSFARLTSVATRSLGINHQLAKKLPPDHPNVKRKYAQGDIVTTIVQTQKGNSIVINYDMQLWRPYDNRWEVQGTDGLYNEQRNAVYLHDRSPKYEEWEPFDPYQEQYEHAWWKALKTKAGRAGHGGADYIELALFVEAVRNKTQTPLDVYDSATMSAVMPLSEKSIANKSQPVKCPDFTRGKWKTRKPSFGLMA